MGHTVIANPSIINAATVTAGSALASMPVSNLLSKQPKRCWRSDDLGSLYLVIDLLTAQSINLIALLFHNASTAATWRLRGATSEANLTAAPSYDSGSVNMWDGGWPTDQYPLHSIKWFGDSPETYQYWRIDISDAANSDNYFQAGRLYIDNAWQLPAYKNIEFGWDVHFIDPSSKARSKGGQLNAETMQSWREIVLPINWQTEDEMYNNLFELQRRQGTTGDVFVMRDPDATTHLLRQSIYGAMKQLPPITNLQAQVFRSRLLIEEML